MTSLTITKRGIICSVLLITVFNLSAQKTRIETGTARIMLEANMTEEQTLQKVEELARIDAIENAFGSYVEQQANLTVNRGKSEFRIIGQTKVKGEWIITLDGPDFRKDYENETLWITCTIKGKIRELAPKASIEFQTLSCPDKNCRSATFYSGEQLYLYFKSPMDGYLSVYLDDGHVINRLLPYSLSANSNAVKILSDQEYCFFTNGKSDSEEGIADELELFTSQEREFNTLYIIFSERNYFKPILNSGKVLDDKYSLPKSLNKSKFEEWLSDNRATFSDFIDRTIEIEIISGINKK